VFPIDLLDGPIIGIRVPFVTRVIENAMKHADAMQPHCRKEKTHLERAWVKEVFVGGGRETKEYIAQIPLHTLQMGVIVPFVCGRKTVCPHGKSAVE
jgi:hypothetical protein